MTNNRKKKRGMRGFTGTLPKRQGVGADIVDMLPQLPQMKAQQQILGSVAAPIADVGTYMSNRAKDVVGVLTGTTIPKGGYVSPGIIKSDIGRVKRAGAALREKAKKGAIEYLGATPIKKTSSDFTSKIEAIRKGAAESREGVPSPTQTATEKLPALRTIDPRTDIITNQDLQDLYGSKVPTAKVLPIDSPEAYRKRVAALPEGVGSAFLGATRNVLPDVEGGRYGVLPELPGDRAKGIIGRQTIAGYDRAEAERAAELEKSMTLAAKYDPAMVKARAALGLTDAKIQEIIQSAIPRAQAETAQIQKETEASPASVDEAIRLKGAGAKGKNYRMELMKTVAEKAVDVLYDRMSLPEEKVKAEQTLSMYEKVMQQLEGGNKEQINKFKTLMKQEGYSDEDINKAIKERFGA